MLSKSLISVLSIVEEPIQGDLVFVICFMSRLSNDLFVVSFAVMKIHAPNI